MKLAALALSTALIAAPAFAAEVPMPGPVDPRIRTVAYDPDQVIRLTGYFGYQMMLEFGPDERIENVSIGDALAWQVTPNKKATVLFLKPVDRASATNMTVVTDRRRYAFDLTVAPPRASQANLAFIVRFRYPQDAAAMVVETAAPVDVPPPLESLNLAYAVNGAPSVAPARVFDDGRSTWFDFPADATLPAIFVVNPDGSETLANFNVRGRYVVVDQKSPRFVLRDGAAVGAVVDTRSPQPAAPTRAEKKAQGVWRRLGWLGHPKADEQVAQRKSQEKAKETAG